MVDCLRKWYKMSPEHRYEILYTASVLGKTFFGWNAETECMQDIMDLCFDEEGNFDKNKKDVILEQVKIKDDEIVNYSLDNDDDEDINEFIISKCDELIEMFG